ncbi:hypothetical protein CVT24_000935 [Panaeolus cyanescens]|uniref:O-methyltransferase domain-containing protein n=1 Tax=Panaeolus cyanescens TaxID=181874 RepID=A0A409YTE0_9AGAR|nr:hypothetical protein CVT24_000935 [Panaeolus cyanescens]
MTPTKNPAVLASRLKELLFTIDQSAQELQKYLSELSVHDVSGAEEHSQGGPAAGDTYQKTFIFHKTPQVATHASVVRMACDRLAHLVTPPMHRVIEAAGSFYTTASLQTCVRGDIADHIEALSKDRSGASVEDLADASKLDQDLLARTLRYLSLHGLFQEVEIGVFQNTTPTRTLINNSEFKADLDYLMHESRLGGFAMESFMKKRYAARWQRELTPALSPFEVYSGGIPIQEWMQLPDNVDRRQNFSKAMQGLSRAEKALPLMRAYPFTSFPRGTVLVDVGSGVRYNLAENLLPACPNLMMIVEDLEHVAKSKIDNASPDMTRWMNEGRLKFQVHDIFKFHPEYLKGSVFVVNNIINQYHENDPRALATLRAIRASNPSRLLIIDAILNPPLNTEPRLYADDQMPHTSPQEMISPKGSAFPQTESLLLPPQSQVLPSIIDLMVATVGGGKVRTLKEWSTLLAHSGFSLNKVYPIRDYRSDGQAVLEAFVV